MLFEFKHGEDEYVVELNSTDSGFTVKINGESRDVDAREVSPGCFNIITDGVSRTVHVASDDGTTYISIDGAKYILTEPSDGDDASSGGVGADLAKGGILVMPMPGKVIKLNVAVGDKVEAGQTLVVIESMKMEQNIKTLVNGKVKKVSCKEGQQVDLEEVLIEVEPDGDGE